MIMLATVFSVRNDHLLVIDLSNRQQVRVNTREAPRFHAGDLIRIRYNGAMTMSIPPQISALRVTRLSSVC